MRGFLLALALSLTAGPAAAQTIRTISSERQQHGETTLAARIEYAAGTLRLAAGDRGALYRMLLSYDADRFAPVSRYDAATNEVQLGLRGLAEGRVRVISRQQLAQDATIELSPAIPLTLDVTLGAVDAELDLGGLQLSEATISTGASRATLSVSRPNPGTCRSLTLNAGAAEFITRALGNTRCARIAFEGGVGTVLLDLTGAWTADADVSADMALGQLTLRLPRDAGVEITLDRFLSSFHPTGFTERGRTWVSDNYDQTSKRLRIDLTSAMGGVVIEWE